MSDQTLVIRVPTRLSRDIRALITGSTAYADISEFAEVALQNQLLLEGANGVDAGSPDASFEEEHSNLLRMPNHTPPAPLPADEIRDPAPLFVLTNRLFPIKVACRVAANLNDGGGVALRELNLKAAEAARQLGHALRHEDEGANRKGPERRWIGLPVSESRDPAMRRFATSFTLHADGSGIARGPLAQLGLATLVNDGFDAQLTETGWRLAVAESPILDSAAGGTLSTAEREIFIEVFCRQAGEHQALREFIEAVAAADGDQANVDQRLQSTHPNWSGARVTSHRAAMLGRMADLGLASVKGRGSTACISLVEDAAHRFGDEKR
jgi:hypothetical protein